MEKTWVFKLILKEGNDEFWESEPSKEDVKNLVVETLELNGIYDYEIELTKYVEEKL